MGKKMGLISPRGHKFIHPLLPACKRMGGKEEK